MRESEHDANIHLAPQDRPRYRFPLAYRRPPRSRFWLGVAVGLGIGLAVGVWLAPEAGPKPRPAGVVRT